MPLESGYEANSPDQRANAGQGPIRTAEAVQRGCVGPESDKIRLQYLVYAFGEQARETNPL